MKFWGVFVVGLLLGLVGGLIYTWFVVPLEYFDTYPPLLSPRYRQDWIRMAAWSFGLEDNWDRTQTRLLNLPMSEVGTTVADVLERAAAEGHPVAVLQRIAKLASAYGASGPGVDVYAEGADALDGAPTAHPVPSPTQMPVRPTPTTTPQPLPTLTFTITPTASLASASPFSIISQTFSCEMKPSIAVSLELSRTVEVRGRETQEQVGLPMREVWLIWDSGADRAITGFRPEKGLGYADFTVEPGRSYNLYIDNPIGVPILTVQVEPCPPAEGEGWVSRMLVLLEDVEPEGPATGTVTATLALPPSPTPSE